MTDNQRMADDRLKQYNDAKRDILAIQQKIWAIEAQCNRITKSPDSIMQDSGKKDQDGNKIYVPIIVQHDRTNAREGYLDSLIDMKNYYWGKCADAENLCGELEREISIRCYGIHARVLSMYYLYNVNLERLAVMENYSYAGIKKVKWRALEEYGQYEKE